MSNRVLAIFSILFGVACASEPRDPAPEVDSVLRVSALVPRAGEKKPVGWVYARDPEGLARSLCVYVWTDGTWTLAGLTGPGYYGDILATGRFGTRAEDGFAPAVGFPSDAFRGCEHLWVGGEVRATYLGSAVGGS
jgi:hypothetical protein